MKKKIRYWPRKMRPQYHYRSRTTSGGWRFTRSHRAHSILKFRRKVPLGVSYVGDRRRLSIRAPEGLRRFFTTSVGELTAIVADYQPSIF